MYDSRREIWLSRYLKILAVFYLLGTALHFLDIFDLRLKFSEMSIGWQVWIVYLLVFDTVAAIGLWRNKSWGVASFLMVATSQILVYSIFSDFFGSQEILIGFHLISIIIFLFLRGLGKF
jgi:hypothetical protein